MNLVILEGCLGKDPELAYAASGTAICKMSLATSESYKDKSGAYQKKTEWHNIKVFGKQGENCSKYLKKGSRVLIEGRVSYSDYEKDGVKKYFTDIISNKIEFLNGQKEAQDQEEAPVYPAKEEKKAPRFTIENIP